MRAVAPLLIERADPHGVERQERRVKGPLALREQRALDFTFVEYRHALHVQRRDPRAPPFIDDEHHARGRRVARGFQHPGGPRVEEAVVPVERGDRCRVGAQIIHAQRRSLAPRHPARLARLQIGSLEFTTAEMMHAAERDARDDAELVGELASVRLGHGRTREHESGDEAQRGEQNREAKPVAGSRPEGRPNAGPLSEARWPIEAWAQPWSSPGEPGRRRACAGSGARDPAT